MKSGEFALIGHIKSRFEDLNKNIMAGIGDDAAIFVVSGKALGLLTIDTLVNNVHFDLAYTSYKDLGHRAMAANLSDIAAMGGEPLLAVVSITIPRNINLGNIHQIYSGMKKLTDKYGVSICGGDTVSGKELSLTIAVFGQANRNNIGKRSGAKAGDAILVTGSLGASQVGLNLLKLKIKNQKSKMVGKHLRPEPRVEEARLLASKFKLHGMIDISDGLASELHHLARQSAVRMIIDRSALPIAEEAIDAAALLKSDPLKCCLYSGEEYELLFTLPVKEALKAVTAVQKTGTECSIIGQVVKGHGVWLIGRDGKRRQIADKGYKHF